MFQIRRYVYHDVIRLDDAAKLVDCDYVQVSSNLISSYHLCLSACSKSYDLSSMEPLSVSIKSVTKIIQRKFNCSWFRNPIMLSLYSLQPYITNSAKVVFINQRPQTRLRSSGNICNTCDRSLQDSYLFCSLSCKVSFPSSGSHLIFLTSFFYYYYYYQNGSRLFLH